MAEQVQASLDDMVAPLADLMDRKIFSQSEIHSIVARRRESEYLLRRRNPRKADYLKYIQDELMLEKLRQLRTKKQQTEERQRLEKLGRLDEYYVAQRQKHIGDPHVIQLIHQLFRRALVKYKDDVALYLQYTEICKQFKSYTKLSRVYAEAVQLHPNETGLWIEAASYEFFHRQSVNTARILLQRALRINPKAQDLWLQSFALELHQITKLLGRKMLLLQKQQEDDDEDKEQSTATTTTTTTASQPPTIDPTNPTLYAVVKIVYNNAIEAIPDDISFRLQFLDLCSKFPNEEILEDYIFQTIRRDFKNNPQAWIVQATRLLEQQQQQQQQQNTDEAEDEEDSGSSSIKPEGFTIAPTEKDAKQEEEEGSEGNASSSSSDSDSDSSDDDDESDGTDDSDNEDEERPTKKRRKENELSTTTSTVHNKDPVLAMIQKAIDAVQSSDMYLKAVKFLWSYWEKTAAEEEEDENENEEEEDTRRQGILEFLKEMLDKVAATTTKNLDIYNVPLVLEHAEFYTRVDQPMRAKEILVNFKEAALAENDRGNSKNIMLLTPIWLELAELTIQEQSTEAARNVIKEALTHTPMSHPDYLRLLLHLLGVELVMENNNNNNRKDAASKRRNGEKLASTETFQKILLLAGGGKSANIVVVDDDADDVTQQEAMTTMTTRETSFGIKSVEQACWQFLLHMIDMCGPIGGVRKTCKIVLHESNFIDRRNKEQTLEDVETLVAFFDNCLELEIDNLKKNKKGSDQSKKERNRSKLCVRQLFDAAIRKFKDFPSLIAKFQQQRLDASLL